LLIRTTAYDGFPSKTIATYRISKPEAALQLGSYYSEQFFIMAPELRLMPGLIELGRACVDREWRGGVAVMRLWSAIAVYLTRVGAKNLIGCVSLPLANGSEDVSQIWQKLKANSTKPLGVLAKPRSELILPENFQKKEISLPPLIKGYINSGGRLLCAPTFDPLFNTADFLFYCCLDEVNTRYKTRFFKRT